MMVPTNLVRMRVEEVQEVTVEAVQLEDTVVVITYKNSTLKIT